jgi:hypothetical protein
MIVEEERDDMSMIKGGIFQGDLVASKDRHLSRSFSMHIMRFETGQPTMPSMKIWLTIFGLT